MVQSGDPWIEIALDPDGAFIRASAEGSDGEQPDAHRLDMSQDDAQAFASAVARAVRAGEPLEKAGTEAARRLHATIFGADVGKLVAAKRAVARRNPVLVRFMVRDRGLQGIPWEAAYAPGAQLGFLATSPDLLVVRGVRSDAPWSPREIDGAVRVLVVGPMGEDSTAHIQMALADAVAAGEITLLPPIVGPDARMPHLFDKLDALVEGNEPHVIHFVGHGVVKDGKPALQLNGEPGDEPLLDVEVLAQRLASRFASSLRLVVLECCDGAKPGAFAGAAEILAQAGADAVIAHLWPVRADVARACSQAVYRSLAGVTQSSGNVAAAVRDARQLVLGTREGSAEAFSPVVYLRGRDAEIFRFRTGRAWKLRWRRYAVALAALVLLGVVVTAVALRKTGSTADTLPVIDRFEPGDGIVVFDQGAGSVVDALLQELRARAPGRAVRRIELPAGARPEALRDQAKAAGAVVSIEVSRDGRAQMMPLEHPDDELFASLLPTSTDLARPAKPAQVAVVAGSLARQLERQHRLDGGRPADYFHADTAACPGVGTKEEPLDVIALLSLFVVPRCRAQVVDARQLLAVCNAPSGAPAQACLLAHYLDADLNGASARKDMEALIAGPTHFRMLATLRLAALDCAEGRLSDAGAVVQRIFDSGPSACVLVQLPEIAACIVTGARDNPDLADLSRSMVPMEGMQIDPKKLCPEPQRAQSLARRGYWRLRGGRWDGAARDFEEAYTLRQDPDRALDRVEALLHGEEDRAEVALDFLDKLRGLEGEHALRRALLRWVASRRALRRPDAAKVRAQSEAEIVELHAAGTGLPRDESGSLRQLVCSTTVTPAAHHAGDRPGNECVYEVLQRKGTKDEVKRSFGGR